MAGGSRAAHSATGMNASQISAPAPAVQPMARAASQPAIGPTTSDIAPIRPSRSALRRPVAPWRCPISTSQPPIAVLTTTMARLSASMTARNGRRPRRNDRERRPEQARRDAAGDQVAAPAGAEQRESVAQQADQRLHVPGERADRPEGRHVLRREMKLVLEEQVQRQPRDHPRPAEAGDEEAGGDDGGGGAEGERARWRGEASDGASDAAIICGLYATTRRESVRTSSAVICRRCRANMRRL